MHSKKKPVTKAECERKHAKRRALERYGIHYNRHVKRELLELVGRHKATLVCKQSNRVKIWDIPYQGQMVRCVYDNVHHEFVTFLPIKSNESSEEDREQSDRESPHTT